MTRLRVIEGGKRRPRMLFVSEADHDGLHLELAAARAERLVATDKARGYVRSALRLLASGHLAACATYLEEIEKLVEQESQRALAMDAGSCPCGQDGAGHGDADADALAVPLRSVA